MAFITFANSLWLLATMPPLSGAAVHSSCSVTVAASILAALPRTLGTSSTSPFYPKPNIPDNNPIINEFLNFYADKPAPKTVAEWNQAGWLMLNMVLDRQHELISNRSPLNEQSRMFKKFGNYF